MRFPWFRYLLVFLVSWTVTAAAYAQDLFPDKNLDAAVRQYVFEKRNNDKPLTVQDVENISTIVAKGKKITNLAGLDKCRSLALLDLADNQIADLAPLKDLANIQSLNLAKNKIVDIKPLAGLTALQYLHLADNQLLLHLGDHGFFQKLLRGVVR